jgi:streptogramin lyase
MLIVGAIVVALAAVGLVVRLVAGPSHPPAASRSLTLKPTTLVSAPAASSVVQGDGGAWLTDDLHDRLIRFDPKTGHTEGSVHLSGRPVALVLLGRHLWVADMVSNAVEELTVSTLHVVRTVKVPTGPSGLVALDGRIWVASVIAEDVTPIDASNGTAGPPVPVAGGAVRIAQGFGALWVTGSTDALTEITPGTSGGTPQLRAITVGNGPIGVATGLGSVWVANTAGGTVARVDPTDLKILHTYRVGGDPLTIAVAGGHVWLGDGTAQTLRTVFPTLSARPIALHSTPRALVPVGSTVWVATANPGRILAVG